MSAIDVLEHAKTLELTGEDGDRREPTYLPGLSVERLQGIEDEIGAPLPKDYRELAMHCGGIDRLFDVWSKNPGVIPYADALKSGDAAVRAFADELDPGFEIVDLRSVPPGMGFSWGRYGMRTQLRRFGEERIFAYAREEKRGFLS